MTSETEVLPAKYRGLISNRLRCHPSGGKQGRFLDCTAFALECKHRHVLPARRPSILQYVTEEILPWE